MKTGLARCRLSARYGCAVRASLAVEKAIKKFKGWGWKICRNSLSGDVLRDLRQTRDWPDARRDWNELARVKGFSAYVPAHLALKHFVTSRGWTCSAGRNVHGACARVRVLRLGDGGCGGAASGTRWLTCAKFRGVGACGIVAERQLCSWRVCYARARDGATSVFAILLRARAAGDSPLKSSAHHGDGRALIYRFRHLRAAR